MDSFKCTPFFIFVILINCCTINTVYAQMITGVWKGKINKQKTELKIIQNGDSLTGTSYYYESSNNYRRYSIKGYFDPQTNAAVWWDDQLVDERSGRFRLSSPGKNALLSRADFNCPGNGRMMLDGKAGKKENEGDPLGDLHLDKTNTSTFKDEWDYVIENYTTVANDPYIIDSIGSLSRPQHIIIEMMKIPEQTNVVIPPGAKTSNPKMKESIKDKDPEPLPTIEQKFVSRKKILVKEISVSGDSIELRFYDNAEIDGDSISLFLNDKLVFQHIRLTGKAYIIKLPVADLKETNELIMVAENLGSIPPNTSYMVAIVGEKRYEARLESTEGSSAMIRLVKAAPPNLP